MNQKRIIPGSLAIVFYSLLIFGKAYYRPYIYGHNLYDFHIADTFPSLLSVPAIFFLAYTFSPKSNNKNSFIILLTAISISYEIYSTTYDILDIGAILVGMLITIVVNFLIKKFFEFDICTVK